MTIARAMAGLLAALIAVSALQRMGQPAASSASNPATFAWEGFLFWLPLALGGVLLTGARWALMAGVIYGTVGLALDISTVVQILTRGDTPSGPLGGLLSSGLTGILNFLLILLGGRGFLDLSLGNGAAPPPGSPPPNPPSPSAT